jgi:very-short-patch-repair endonuclease
VFSSHAELSQVTGVTQELLREQFAAADREAIRLYSERVAAIIDQRPVPYGNQSGPVRTWTEMALIMNEINKQKRHIPIRQLIRRSANALAALKPCFMMGPLSVAQYLAPGQLKFDLIVMDEASQLKPEDAIGALARGGQVVIVGDPKQLPPTSFFQRVSLDSEEEGADDTRTAVEEGESILDVASTLFQPVRRLRWHYRSRHHSLIAFSNNEFYRDLIIFPSAYHDDPSLGVKHHFISGGVFENSRNPREAAVVVEAVLVHMREHSNESLGVVTLNFEQRELVEELLDRKLRDDPAAIAFQERMKGGQETLFVKNLENVQGDERDVIFISTTYGPDTRGNQFQRFGPINGPSGHRRLNVLFTRAKKRVVVFSSLDPERMQTTANSPWGVRALKQYLIYARTGVLQQPEERSGDQETNDFEVSVGAVLKEKGYQVVPQVGVAGFFIDLGVKHPAKAGTFLLGIECDGASYHSGRSARDRDRLRQEILENLGWKIHRVWSTDWFKNRDGEIRRLLRRIEEILESDPAYTKEQAKANRAEQLRQRLITLRDSEIRVAFPDTPAEKCLLNQALLDEFLQKKPKTRDDWFRRISQPARTNVDSKQVGKYLDTVLQAIREDG